MGYLGMHGKVSKTRYHNTYSEIVEFFTSNTTKFQDEALFGDDLMLSQYQMIDDASDLPRKSNVILASFTTANPRAFFTTLCEKSKKPSNVLYCDTDNIKYVQDSLVSL